MPAGDNSRSSSTGSNSGGLENALPDLLQSLYSDYSGFGPSNNLFIAALEQPVPNMWFFGSMPVWEAVLWFLMMTIAWEYGVREIVMSSPKLWIGLLILRAGMGWLNSFVPEIDDGREAEEDTKENKKRR
jgi:hypothetical protein